MSEAENGAGSRLPAPRRTPSRGLLAFLETGAAPLRPTPDAFFLASGLDPREVDEAAEAATRECSHVLHMDSGRGAFVGLSRWALAAFGAEIPAFRVSSLLRGDRS